MAAVLPPSREQMIQWFNQRIASWAAAPTTIGLSAAQLTELASKLNSAGAEQSAAFDARINSRNQTLNYHNAADDLRTFGADLIKTIKAFAEATDDPSVYTAASVPPPSPPTPLGPPDVPTALTATPDPYGYVVLAWKGARVGGTQFILERQMVALDGTLGAWTYAGTSAGNDYTDITIPPGFRAANYRVYAQRSGGQSKASQIATLWFGSNAESAGVNTSVGDGGLNLAA